MMCEDSRMSIDAMSPIKEEPSKPQRQRKPLFSKSWIEMIDDSKSSDDSFFNDSNPGAASEVQMENDKLNSLMEIKQQEIMDGILKDENEQTGTASICVKTEEPDYSSEDDDLDLSDPNIKIKIEAEVKHELEIQLLDPNNAKKYDRLSNSAEKSKIPFKRRHSETSQNPTVHYTKFDTFNSPENMKKYRGNDGSIIRRHNYDKNRTNSGSTESSNSVEYETDPQVIGRRQKQIDYGKNTVGYSNYIAEIPREKREREHPKTPNKNLKYSRRAWDGLIKIWRKKLHVWDTNGKEDDDQNTSSSDED